MGIYVNMYRCVFTYMYICKNHINTVDGRNPANQLKWRVHPFFTGFLCISGGAGFLPSTVCH